MLYNEGNFAGLGENKHTMYKIEIEIIANPNWIWSFYQFELSAYLIAPWSFLFCIAQKEDISKVKMHHMVLSSLPS